MPVVAGRVLTIAASAGAMLGLLAGPAHAATSVSKSGGSVSVLAAPGKANRIEVRESMGITLAGGRPSGPRFTITDAGDTVTAGPGCWPVDANRVSCDSIGVVAVQVDAGDFDDMVTKVTSVRGSVHGGEGSDTLRGGTSGTAFGPPEGGPSSLYGGPGSDTLIGGPNRDELDGGPGADILDGGLDSDVATYEGRSGSIAVTLDDVADDGATVRVCSSVSGACSPYSIERDNVKPTVENVTGGDGGDTITGSAAHNRLEGGPGADVLTALGGNDTLRGDAGADTLYGGDGRDAFVSTTADGGDVVYGGPGAWDRVTYAGRSTPVEVDIGGGAADGAVGEGDDVKGDVEQVVGGAGDDQLTGDAGANVLIGGPGNDQLSGLGGGDLLVGDDDAAGPQPADPPAAGSPGNDILQGGDGDDRLDGGMGADQLRGDVGRDLVDYGARTARLTVVIDVVAGDGETGEGDNVHTSVEDVLGGSGDDVLEGSRAGNRLLGGGGMDTLRGFGGDDELTGGPNADLLVGGFGDDALLAVDGVSGNDASAGNEGLDSCSSDAGDSEAVSCERDH